MPQMNKGGKSVLGLSHTGWRHCAAFLRRPLLEYSIAAEGRVYLFTGAR